MKTLTLLRHAKSDWDDMTLRDFDRTLNDRGRRGAEAMGAHLRRMGWHCDAALASPAARVKRTIEGTAIDVRPRYDDRLYLADACSSSPSIAGPISRPVAASWSTSPARATSTRNWGRNASASKMPAATFAIPQAF